MGQFTIVKEIVGTILKFSEERDLIKSLGLLEIIVISYRVA